MNLLVVGGAGYIGGITVRALLEAGHKVVILDNLSKGNVETIPDLAVFHRGDLADGVLVKRICKEQGIDCALHFAAFIEVGESVAQPAQYFDNNTVKTKALLDALLESGVRQFIFSSTAAVYGEPLQIPIPEDHPQSPTNPYGWSKLFVEKILEAYHAAYGLRSIRLRYFNAAGAAYGLGEAHNPETHLIPILLDVAMGARAAINLYGDDWDTEDGTCIRDFIHVADLADAHVKAAEALQRGHEGGAFNLGNGTGASVMQAVEATRRVTGCEIPFVACPRRPGDPARLVASSAAAREALGWSPRHPDLEEIIRSAYEWKKAHPKGYEKL